MKKQRNVAQMKEQIKTLEKELNEMGMSNYQMQSSKYWMLNELSEDLSSIKKI